MRTAVDGAFAALESTYWNLAFFHFSLYDLTSLARKSSRMLDLKRQQTYRLHISMRSDVGPTSDGSGPGGDLVHVQALNSNRFLSF